MMKCMLNNTHLLLIYHTDHRNMIFTLLHFICVNVVSDVSFLFLSSYVLLLGLALRLNAFDSWCHCQGDSNSGVECQQHKRPSVNWPCSPLPTVHPQTSRYWDYLPIYRQTRVSWVYFIIERERAWKISILVDLVNTKSCFYFSNVLQVFKTVYVLYQVWSRCMCYVFWLCGALRCVCSYVWVGSGGKSLRFAEKHLEKHGGSHHFNMAIH